MSCSNLHNQLCALFSGPLPNVVVGFKILLDVLIFEHFCLCNVYTRGKNIYIIKSLKPNL